MKKIAWLGLLEEKPIELENATPAQILQQCLEDKWKLDKEDKDMIVMLHEFEYELEGKQEKLVSSLVILGEDSRNTAMAKGVGLPLAIATKLLLTGKLERRGVCYPTTPDIYEPVLEELSQLGINFTESIV